MNDWVPPACFFCENFIGITGMDIMCKKENGCLGIVGKSTFVKCKKYNWFRGNYDIN